MEGEPVKKRTRKNFGLIIILVFLLIAIIGLSIGIVIKLNDQNGVVEEEEATLSNLVTDYLFNSDSEVDVWEVEKELESMIEVSDNQDETVQAAFDLILLNNDDSVLRELLKTDLSLENRYLVLSGLLNFYNSQNKKAEYREILLEIVKLPNEMVLEGEDWSKIKPMLEEKLEIINKECGDEE